MKVLGLIPARAGSKGVKGKNTKLLNGIPLIGYTIEAALRSQLIHKVVVSTEDALTAEISKELGAEVPFLRPNHLATDQSPTIDTVLHAVDYFVKTRQHFDAVCLLQPTVPFRKTNDIDGAIEQFRKNDVDALFSVSRVPDKFNPHWTFLLHDDRQQLRLATGEQEIITRRQDLPDAFIRDGSIYLTKTKVLLEKKSLYGERIGYYEKEGGVDLNIDTLEDWAMAEKIIQSNER